MSAYLGSCYMYFKWSAADSADKEDGISSIKNMFYAAFLRHLLFAAGFLKVISFLLTVSDSRKKPHRGTRGMFDATNCSDALQ